MGSVYVHACRVHMPVQVARSHAATPYTVRDHCAVNVPSTTRLPYLCHAPLSGGRGDPGPLGPKGDDGNDGLTGPQGPTGPQGETGMTGPPGVTGARGPKGDPGPPGPSGGGSEGGRVSRHVAAGSPGPRVSGGRRGVFN